MVPRDAGVQNIDVLSAMDDEPAGGTNMLDSVFDDM
jgi:hypothetical protein